MSTADIGIYIHIPFCVHKCNYCDFNSYAGMEDTIEAYFDALIREIRTFSRTRRLSADTVYLGGGTPSCVDTKYITAVLDEIFTSFNIMKESEISMECNPGTVTGRELSALRGAGINRLSIGLQSTDDKMLAALGRIHSLRDFEDCFSAARGAGFDNISADLMYGLPNQTAEHWHKTLERAAAFGAEHLSCYSLKIEEGTPFYTMGVAVPDDDTVADMYADCVEFLGGRGYARYEISNFAKSGFESRHNLKYWRCDDFIGFGAGAYSCMNGSRFSNIGNVDGYIRSVNSKGNAAENTSVLEKSDRMSEFVFLGLRCEKGIDVREFARRFGCDIFDVYGEPLKKYIKLGFIIHDDPTLRLSHDAFFVSNTILADFV